MSLRFQAINNLSNQPADLAVATSKISAIFGENVFTLKTAREYLSDDAYKSLLGSIKGGKKIDRAVAASIANGMRAWAESKGVTHFTHWFQPLTGTTAEKHDSFFTLKGDGTALEQFDGDALIQQEPDASSFPSGGLRATFEARGYTAWDPSSPAFIIEIGQGKTLCIPTIFVSYTGESLDYKAPLLKALESLNKAAVDVCNYFDKNVTKVTATLGWEQEYFVIDERLANARPDLVQCGRTVFGAAPAKGQQLEDHYFGSIPERVYHFMRDFENECYKLGIPLKTRHNEVAPSQFEVAPIFEEVSVAVDHNALLMDIMDRVARRHKLRVLIHEKPFAGINGNGKHNNWSMATDTGVNLLSPGKTPKTNLMFLTFFVNTIKAVHDYSDLLRSSIASAGNDHRLGANEAPPAIISVFVGQYLAKVLNEIETRVSDKFDEQDEAILKLDIHRSIPELMLDNTDRNRTSPFAFTGNKFEFRAVGSSANCANPMTVLNVIMAETLQQFKKDVDALIEKGDKKEIAIMQTIQKYIVESKKVLFEGDGYSEAWHHEAERRGLPNVPTTPLALDAMVTDKAKKLFEKNGVFSVAELEARHEIELEKYIKKVQIEARIMGDLALNHIIPTAIKYQNELIQNITGLKAAGIPESQYKSQLEILNKISEHLQVVYEKVHALVEARKVANNIENTRTKAIAYCTQVKETYFDVIRYHVDKLEALVDDEHWSLPKYRELLFLR
ncbi:MAG: glutamine synthetase type III [Hydrotalea flava]|uniref:glutamine synthetase III family protein n=1 Tax=Hydrotalea TaxID=1004300 RepID=UPI0009467FFB|nr:MULTISPECIES: glutamine synthetase III [Hydrotalea]MBY0349248.1 glutamine synthetase III [Hydrotalea flava]NIM34824.1 glutamine synthetase type III [Hydrotalea flava]NIM37649.1 glutamine synthetase type III [Hydrotalea flava]NIN02820.1 glutamine synthetase type III [Hydrotalea flava]NIN14505.1 glutamine synthetase type III [Hydrotalea flava]